MGGTYSLGGGPELIHIVYGLGGEASARTNGRTFRLDPRSICVISAGASADLRARTNSELLVLSVAASSIGPAREPIESGAGRVWATDDGSGTLVAGLLSALGAQMDQLVSDNAGRLAQHVIGLIAVMCADVAPVSVSADSDVSLVQIKRYIEDNLGDADLTPDAIARVHCVSTRTLRRLFEGDGETVSGWIRQRRMEQCRLDLIDAASSTVPVSSIGARWGMWDAAHFSRLFKSSYGLSPRALRSAHRSVRHAQASSLGHASLPSQSA